MAGDRETEANEELTDSEMPDQADVREGEETGTYPCPYCGKEVYEDAVRCPHCQRYVSREEARSHHPWQWVVLLLLLALAGLGIWAMVR